MRNNGPITHREVEVPEGTVIVSRTDPQGRIQFVNQAFVNISGFSEGELLGMPHNIVRHPHMPPAAFADLWATIKAGRPWEGLVKNRTKTGDHYWVRANVTPVIEAGQITGYISIRSRPSREDVAAAEQAYSALRAPGGSGLTVEDGMVRRTGSLHRLVTAANSIGGRLGAGLAALLLLMIAGPWIGLAIALPLAAAVAAAMVWVVEHTVNAPLRRLEEHLEGIARGDISQAIETAVVPEFQRTFSRLRSLRARLAYAALETREKDAQQRSQAREALLGTCKTIEDDLNVTWIDVERSSQKVGAGISELLDSLTVVRDSTLVVSSAANQASANAANVAAATEQLSAAGAEIARQAVRSSTVARRAVDSARNAATAVKRMESATGEISQVAELIASIAGQTNLLALNATIEAARAGEAGRGFAVVATEVKNLAGQTAKATEEIAQQIAELRRAVEGSVQSIGSVIGVIEEIDQAAAGTAAAVEEQSAANAEIGRSASESASGATQLSRSVDEIRDRTTAITAVADEVGTRVAATPPAGADLKRRLIIAPPPSVAGDRRDSDRIPCELPATLAVAGRSCTTTLLDISLGGFLLDPAGLPAMTEGTRVDLTVPEVGSLSCLVVGSSDLGLHLSLGPVDPGLMHRLEALHHRLEQTDAPLVKTAQAAADKISAALANAVARQEIPEADLFSTQLTPVPGSDPEQFLAPYTSLCERLLPGIQDPVLAADPRIEFCVAVTLFGYAPTHNKEASQPQRPGQRAWNMLHSRNRQVFADRTGLMAARNRRPFLLQAYRRDLGGGKPMRIKEVDVPILVGGRHWGALRVGYRVS